MLYASSRTVRDVAGAERQYFLAIAALAAVVALVIGAFWLGTSVNGGSDGPPLDRAALQTPVVERTQVSTPVTTSPSAGPTASTTPSATPTTPSPTPVEEPDGVETPTVVVIEPSPVQTPEPTIETRDAAPAAEAGSASLTGNWRILDTVTEGAGSGQSFTFDVALVQSGSSLQGGNFELSIVGTVDGGSVIAQFAQPSGITGTFSWTVIDDGSASGTFESSVPNSGTSQLIRLP
jgi:hypothetical protein